MPLPNAQSHQGVLNMLPTSPWFSLVVGPRANPFPPLCLEILLSSWHSTVLLYTEYSSNSWCQRSPYLCSSNFSKPSITTHFQSPCHGHWRVCSRPFGCNLWRELKTFLYRSSFDEHLNWLISLYNLSYNITVRPVDGYDCILYIWTVITQIITFLVMIIIIGIIIIIMIFCKNSWWSLVCKYNCRWPIMNMCSSAIVEMIQWQFFCSCDCLWNMCCLW